MNGYCEWQKNQDGTKTPTYLHPQDEGELLAERAVSPVGFRPPPGRGGLWPRVPTEVPPNHLIKDQVVGRGRGVTDEVDRPSTVDKIRTSGL